MKRLFFTICAVSLAAPAAAETYSQGISAFGSSQAQFNGFDGSLGTLQKVTFDLSGTTIFDVSIPYPSGTVPPSGTVQYNFTNTAFLYLNSSMSPFNLQPTVTETANSTSALTYGQFSATSSGTHTLTEITNASTLAAFYNTTFSGGVFPDPPYSGSYSVNGGSSMGLAGLNFTVTSRSLSGQVIYTYLAAGGAVPEPATWAMMLLGFGMIAGAIRYRRLKTAVSFA